MNSASMRTTTARSGSSGIARSSMRGAAGCGAAPPKTKECTRATPSSGFTRHHVSLTVLSQLLSVALVAACAGGSTGQAPAGQNQPAAATVAAAPTDPVTRLESIAREQFPGNNNRNVPYLRALTVLPQADGGYAVKIDFNAADNLSEDYIRGGIENEMWAAYQALFTSGEEVREVWIGAYFPLLDAKGNSSDELVWRTMLDDVTAADINWENAVIIDWPKVWTTTVDYWE